MQEVFDKQQSFKNPRRNNICFYTFIIPDLTNKVGSNYLLRDKNLQSTVVFIKFQYILTNYIHFSVYLKLRYVFQFHYRRICAFPYEVVLCKVLR